MRVIKIQHIKTIMPNGGSGTGYSEPDKLKVSFDNGTEKEITVDIWYRPKNMFKEQFAYGLAEAVPLHSLQNFEEAFEMYLDEICDKIVYTKAEILEAYNHPQKL